MALIPQFFIDSVASVGIRQGTEIKWIGTGFFIVKHIEENKFQPFMVTNKHVFDGLQSVVIRLIERNTKELRIIDMPLVIDGKRAYSVHPDDKVDVAVILLNGSYITENNLDFSAFNIDEHAMTTEEFINNGGNEGSTIFMLGYPMGLVNIKSSTPICRTGCVARIDKFEVRESKNMLLDIQNFPGNSGSPIVAKPEIVSIEGTKALDKCVLIGIIHSYIPYQETLINSQTGKVVEIRSENSGIAKANPVEYIKEVVEIEYRRHYT